MAGLGRCLLPEAQSGRLGAPRRRVACAGLRALYRVDKKETRRNAAHNTKSFLCPELFLLPRCVVRESRDVDFTARAVCTLVVLYVPRINLCLLTSFLLISNICSKAVSNHLPSIKAKCICMQF